MMKLQNLFLLLIGSIALVFCVGNSSVYAQDISNDTRPQYGWINAGVGGSSWGLSGGGGFSYQYGRSLFSIRFTYGEVPDWGWGSSSVNEWGYDVGALYGRIAKARYGFASVSAGIGLVRRVKEYKEDFFTVGIPIEGQLFFTPLPFLGIGFYPFANLNLKDIPYGFLLCVQIGKLWIFPEGCIY